MADTTIRVDVDIVRRLKVLGLAHDVKRLQDVIKALIRVHDKRESEIFCRQMNLDDKTVELFLWLQEQLLIRELAKKAAGMDWPDKCSVLKAMLEEALRPKLVELEEEDYFEFSGFFNDGSLEIRDKTGGLRGGFIFNDLHQLKLFVREVVKRWTDKDRADEPVEMKIDF